MERLLRRLFSEAAGVETEKFPVSALSIQVHFLSFDLMQIFCLSLDLVCCHISVSFCRLFVFFLFISVSISIYSHGNTVVPQLFVGKFCLYLFLSLSHSHTQTLSLYLFVWISLCISRSWQYCCTTAVCWKSLLVW